MAMRGVMHAEQLEGHRGIGDANFKGAWGVIRHRAHMWETADP